LLKSRFSAWMASSASAGIPAKHYNGERDNNTEKYQNKIRNKNLSKVEMQMMQHF